MKFVNLSTVEKGSFGLPLLCDEAILCTQHNSDVNKWYAWICKCCAKKRKKGVTLDVNYLASCSAMQKLCKRAFDAAIGMSPTKEGRALYKQYIATKIVDDVNSGQWD